MSSKKGAAGFIVVGTFILSSALALSAQMQMAKPMSDEDYSKAMKQIGPTFMNLQKDNASMNHAQGAKDAQMLADWFKQVQTYWEAKKVEDAVGFAKSAAAAADATVKASASMDMATLGDAQKTLAGACQSCHSAHRERLPDGSFKIK